jgi:hypothetical protein
VIRSRAFLPTWLLQIFRRAPSLILDAATDRRIVHAEATGAAGIHHGHHGVATGLDHLAAFSVAAGASHGHAVFGHIETAHAHHHIAIHHHHTVHHHAAANHAATEHGAKILQHAGGHFVFANTGHFHAAIAFFHFHGAAWDDHHIHTGGSGHRRVHGHSGHHHLSFHSYHNKPFF